MPSRMCINPIHNKKGILNRSDNETTEERSEFLKMTLKTYFCFVPNF